MTTTELAADMMERNVDMLKMHLADFSDADMLVRPAPGANHAAWQLGHLIASEVWMLNTYGATHSATLPAGFAEKFKKETASIDDPAAFPSKAELFAAFDQVRAASVKWVKTLSQSDLDKPGPEKMKAFAATLGHLAMMMPLHAIMHIGQFQVIRRKLGKPVLF